MKPHVLLCDSLSFWGGGEHWIVVVAARLAERGWRTTVAGRHESELIRRAKDPGLNTVAWPYSRDFDPATISAANSFLQRESPDIVILTTGRDIRTVGIAARWRGLPVIWRMGPMPKHNWLHRATGEWVVNRVIAPSQYVATELERFPWLRGKTTVIPNGIPETPLPTTVEVAESRRRLGFYNEECVVLYLGRLIHAKGVDLLVRAFGPVAAEHPHARLLLVGAGPEEESLRRLVTEAGLADRVQFTGFKDSPSDYLKACDLLVLPSRSETFGFVLLEAMMYGKLAIATRTGGIPEVVDETAAIIVPSENVDSMTHALNDLIGNPDLRRTKGERGRARVVKLFTESSMVDSVERVFGEIVGHESAVPPKPQAQMTTGAS